MEGFGVFYKIIIAHEAATQTPANSEFNCQLLTNIDYPDLHCGLGERLPMFAFVARISMGSKPMGRFWGYYLMQRWLAGACAGGLPWL